MKLHNLFRHSDALSLPLRLEAPGLIVSDMNCNCPPEMRGIIHAVSCPARGLGGTETLLRRAKQAKHDLERHLAELKMEINFLEMRKLPRDADRLADHVEQLREAFLRN